MISNCEMCGATLNVKKAINAVVVCEYCDSATNIHGVSRLDLSSDERASALIKRGFILAEFQVWCKARYVLNKALESDDKNANAYLGLLLVDTKRSKVHQLLLNEEPLFTNENYQKAMEFGDDELKIKLKGFNNAIIEKSLQKKKELEEKNRNRERRRLNKQVYEIEVQKRRKARSRRRLIISIAIGVPLILLTGITIRDRVLSIENLRTYSNLSSAVAFVNVDEGERIIDRRGLNPTDNDRAYEVNSRVRNAVGFSRITFTEWGIILEDVTRLSGERYLISANLIAGWLSRNYGVQVEVVEYDMELQLEEGVWRESRFLIPGITVEEVRFVKDNQPVTLRRTEERLYVRRSERSEEILVDRYWRGGLEVTWTLIVGGED